MSSGKWRPFCLGLNVLSVRDSVEVQRTAWSSGCLSIAIVDSMVCDYYPELASIIEAETNGRHFPDDILKWIFLNDNVSISIEISLKFVPTGQINNIPALVQIMIGAVQATSH